MPIMRVLRTSLYRQEVLYAVLVHSPEDNQRFEEYPELADDAHAFCAYRKCSGQNKDIFIWRAEAMSGIYKYELIQNPEEKLMVAQEVTGWPQYYVWDHVALALHVESGQVLKFDSDRLRENIKFCQPDDVTVIPKDCFHSDQEAENLVKRLWPECTSPLEKESSLDQSFASLSL